MANSYFFRMTGKFDIIVTAELGPPPMNFSIGFLKNKEILPRNLISKNSCHIFYIFIYVLELRTVDKLYSILINIPFNLYSLNNNTEVIVLHNQERVI